MPLLPYGIRRAFRLAARRPRIEEEVDAEVAFHLEMRTRELVLLGRSPDAAREEALRRFGDLRRWSDAMEAVDRERTRQARRSEWWRDLGRDLRYTLRGLRRQPLFTAGVIVTLALGIGANATMFGVVDRLLLRAPEHVVDAGGVRRFYEVTTDEGREDVSAIVSYGMYHAMRDSLRGFADVAVWAGRRTTLGTGPDAREVSVVLASARLFPILGVRPALGRFFGPDEDREPAGQPVAVLSHELWQRDFGGDSAVVGRTLRLGTTEHTVVGVAPPRFTGADLERVDAWVPITSQGESIVGRFSGENPWYTVYDVGFVSLLGRLRPGVSTAQAEAELALRLPRALASGPAALRPQTIARRKPHIRLGPIQAERGPERSDEARVAAWLLGVSLLVLVIACANVANLLLARALRRRREIAVRVALGAGRGRLVRQLLQESVLLALAGGIGGVLVAHWGGALVRTLLLPDVVWPAVLADVRLLAVAFAAALVTGVVAGLVPALQASRPQLAPSLKAGAREGGGQRSRARATMLVVQAALSVVLLAGAGLFVRSLHNATTVDLGFDAPQVLIPDVNFAAAGYTREAAVDVYAQVLARVQAIPGVASAALSLTQPFGTIIHRDVRVPGRDSAVTLNGQAPEYNTVTADYFRTMGTRLVRGRAFGAEDRAGAPLVAVVNETMARALWPGADALGRCVQLGDSTSAPCATVVGVAEDVKWNAVRDADVMQLYVPLAQDLARDPFRALLVRPAGAPEAVAAAVRRELLAVAPNLTSVTVQPLQAAVDPSLRSWRLGATMFVAFGGLALLLAAVGLYSVLAFSVAARSHEMGVRIALGAHARDVLRLVVGEGVRVAAVGVAIGLVVVLAAGRLVESLLFETSPRDPLVLGGVAVVLVVVATAASLLPGLRATRADPNVALRAE